MRSDRYKEEDQKKEEKRIKMPKVKRSGKPKAERSDAAMADTGSEPKTKRGRRSKAERGSGPKMSFKEKLADKRRAKKGAEQQAPEPVVFSASFAGTGLAAAGFAAGSDDNAFDASVRSAEPILSIAASKSSAEWRKELPANIVTGILYLSFFALFCMVTDSYEVIPAALPVLVVYLAITTFGSIKPGMPKFIAAGVAGVLLIAALIIWHDTIGGGLAYLMNSFYDIAESEQAYLYTRISAGADATDTDAMIGIVWLSSLIGVLAALPPANIRRMISSAAAAAMMIAFAYYGLIPSSVCIAVMLAALILLMPENSVLSAVPVLLAALILFGALTALDPGENYTISRMDENFRDRFAFSSSLIQKPEEDTPEMTDPLTQLNDPQMNDQNEDDFSGEYSTYIGWGIAALILAALLAAAFLVYRRLKKRRDAVRKGINSSDPREAITAMFPYTVRWLKAYGIDHSEGPFSLMLPAVKNEFDNRYTMKFRDMYLLWREAAYSEHSVTGSDKTSMEHFMNETMDMVDKSWNTGKKIQMRIRHAL